MRKPFPAVRLAAVLPFLLLSLSLLHAPASAGKPSAPRPPAPKIWYVSAAKGSDVNAGDRAKLPLATVGAALAKAGAGDVVKVAEGIYTESLRIAARTSISVTGGWDAAFSAQDPDLRPTVVRFGESAPVVAVDNSDNILVDGFTLDGGNHVVHVSNAQADSRSLRIVRSTVTNALSYGIYVTGAWVDIEACRIVLNGQSAIAAHAPYINRGSIIGNVIDGNGARYCGDPALYLISDKAWDIHNNLVARQCGSGIHVAYPGMRALVRNNTIVHNTGAGCSSGYYGSLEARNNVIAFNGEQGIRNWNVNYPFFVSTGSNVLYGNVLGATDNNVDVTFGDIDADPLLDADFRLTAGSPAIDAGLDFSAFFTDDIDGEARTLLPDGDGRYDIGMDEYRPY